MPIYRGTYFGQTFQFGPEEEPIDITGWTFRAHFRPTRDEPNPPELELTTANGGFQVSNGPAGLLLMQMLAEQTITIDNSKVVFDVLRTDIAPGPVWLFEGTIPVRDPITHD